MNKPYRLMTHMIPWYPDRDASMEVAKAMVLGGAAIIEVQFPFSDPTADGPTIEAACTQALKAGFTVDQGFAFVAELTRWIKGQGHRAQVFIMSYASIPYARGVARFVEESARAGAEGLIIPDLPPDSDEGLYALGAAAGLAVIPVVVPYLTDERLAMILDRRPDYVYGALRAGTTGTDTSLSEESLAFVRTLGSRGAKVLAGFGISRPEQVATLAPHVHACIVGSALVRVIQESDPARRGENVRTSVVKLAGATLQ